MESAADDRSPLNYPTPHVNSRNRTLSVEVHRLKGRSRRPIASWIKSSLQNVRFTDEEWASWTERMRSYNLRTYQSAFAFEDFSTSLAFPSSAPPSTAAHCKVFRFPKRDNDVVHRRSLHSVASGSSAHDSKCQNEFTGTVQLSHRNAKPATSDLIQDFSEPSDRLFRQVSATSLSVRQRQVTFAPDDPTPDVPKTASISRPSVYVRTTGSSDLTPIYKSQDTDRNKQCVSSFAFDKIVDEQLVSLWRAAEQLPVSNSHLSVADAQAVRTSVLIDGFGKSHILFMNGAHDESEASSSQRTVISSGFLIYERFFPHFSLWISLAHFTIFVSAIILFGLSPFGSSGRTRILGRVVTPNLVVDHVCRSEFQSWFVDLRQPDLIRLGARFGPCMRPDASIEQEVVERQRASDRASGCCIRNDGSGCFQTQRDRCSPLLSTWSRYDSALNAELFFNSAHIFQGSTEQPTKLLGPVCGLDPAYCLDPHASSVDMWSTTDITEWPVCRVPFNQSAIPAYATHMHCEVTGRPCCVGVRGECIITTKEHCAFIRGIYNPKASLCSQVNCLERSCGMWGFFGQRIAIQFDRTILSLFIHANLPTLLISLFLQLVHMRFFEQVMNWWRICLIFLLSGLLGSVASVLAHPYQIGAGPSHMGILVAQLLDFIYHRSILEDEYRGILCISMTIICLFLLGFFPWLDNTANIGSALAGTLLYHVFAPWQGYMWLRTVCAAAYVVLVASVTTVLYVVRALPHCSWCSYLTCAPLIPGSCDRFQLGADSHLDCVQLDW